MMLIQQRASGAVLQGDLAGGCGEAEYELIWKNLLCLRDDDEGSPREELV